MDKVDKTEKKRNPVPPFITSQLQQEASRKLRFSVKKTMMLAQRLYEGIELGSEGSVGLITYMRTDSTRVSDDALQEVRNSSGPVLTSVRSIFRKSPSSTGARRGLRTRTKPYARPVNHSTPKRFEHYLGPDEYKLYKLIWQRFVASQMKPALFRPDLGGHPGRRISVQSHRIGHEIRWLSGGVREGKDEKDEEDEELEHKLPLLTAGEILQAQQALAGATFHSATSSIHRSNTGQDTGRERVSDGHRPTPPF